MEIIKDYTTVEAIIRKPLVMIVAKTHACSTCQMIVPHLQANLKHGDAYEQYQVYVDDMDAFRGAHVIFSVPTVLIFSEGKELLRESRFINIGKINRLLDAYFG